MKGDYDGNSDLICFCQRCDDAFQIGNSALPERSAIAHATMTHTATRETPQLGAFLQEQTLDRERQAASQAVGFPAFLFTNYRHCVSIRPAPVHGALQKNVSITLLVGVLYLLHYPTLARHSRERRMYDFMKHCFFWLYIAIGVNTTAKDCCSCTKDGYQNQAKAKALTIPSCWTTLEFGH